MDITREAHLSGIVKAAEQKLTEVLPGIVKRGETLCIQWARRNVFSEVVCLALGDGVGAWRGILKIITPSRLNIGLGGAWAKARAKLEFETLRKLHSGFEDIPDCGVPQPLFVIPEFDALMMEYCPGPALSDIFRGAKIQATGKSFSRLLQYAQRVGRWARRFHALTDPKLAGPESVDDIVEFCTRIGSEIVSAGHSKLPNNFSEIVTSRVARLQEALHSAAIPVARKHDDYGPWNMIASKNRLIVIDFAAEKRGPCCSDVLKLLVFLEDLKQNPIFSAKRLGILRNEILAGYGLQDNFPQEAAIICEIKHRLSSVYHCVNTPARNPLKRYISHRILGNHLNWLVNERSHTSMWPVESDPLRNGSRPD